MSARHNGNGKGNVRKLGKRGEIDVSVVLREGVIATLSIGRWRAQQRLLPEDIGFEKEDTTLMQEYMSLGQKTLIPPIIQRKLNSIENTARYALKRHSLDTPFGIFVPASAYPALDLEMKRFESAWFHERDLLVSKMRANLREVRQAYGEVAKMVFETCGRDKARKYAKRIVQGIPLPETVTDSFTFEFQVFNVPQPALLDRAIRTKIVKEERESGKLQREDKLNKMNELILERYAERKQRQVDAFLTGVNSQVRGMVHEAVTAALDSHKHNKDQFVGRTALQLQNMVKRFNMMNILNDKEIEKEIKTLQDQLDLKPKDRTNSEIKNCLTNLEAISKEVELELNQRVARGRSNLLDDGQQHHIEGIDLPRVRRASASLIE